MGEHLYTFDDPPSQRHLQKAARILEDGGVLAYPTDVNWGFGCDAANPKALERIRRLKPTRPKESPFSLLCASISMASEVGKIDHSAYRFLRKAWPGPYTILLEATRSLPKQIKDKRRVVGVRIPDSRLILAVVETLGRPLATTSVPPVKRFTGEEIPLPPKFGYEVFDAYGSGIDLLLDLGEEVRGQESTIIDYTEGYPQLVREGAGNPDMLDFLINNTAMDERET